MNSFVDNRIVFFAALIALLGSMACEWPSRVSKPEEAKPPEVYEVAKEAQGLTLTCMWAGIAAPAKVSFLFGVQNAAGAPVRALACENFSVYEDSVRVSTTESEYRVVSPPAIFKMHTLLLLDMSGSVTGDKLDSLKAAAGSFVRALLLGTAQASADVGVFWFDGSEHIHALIEFNSDTSKILAALQSLNAGMPTDRSTNLHGAVIEGVLRMQTEVRQQNADEVAHGALVVFSDGTDRADRYSFAQAKTAVDSSGASVSVYVIGLGAEIDAAKLQALGKDGFVYTPDLALLVPKFEETAAHIQTSIESRYLLEYCSPKRRGRHLLKVEVLQTELYGLRGTLTISFPADSFTGGCEIESPCVH